MVGGIEPVHAAAQIKVTVGVELAHEAPCVALQIALHLELHAERIVVRAPVRVEPDPPEAAVPLQRRAVGDHPELAGDAHAALGVVVVVVVALVPVRVEADRLALQRADRDRERQGAGGAGDVDVAGRGAGMAQQVGQGRQTAHRAADQAGQPLDAQPADQGVGGVGAVFDRQVRKPEPVGFAGLGVNRGRTGRALAAAQRVDTDHEPAIAVDRLAGPEHRFPPARLRVVRVAGRVRGGREAGEDQNGVVTGGVERAPGLVGQARPMQRAAAPEPKRRGQGEKLCAGRNQFGHGKR